MAKQKLVVSPGHGLVPANGHKKSPIAGKQHVDVLFSDKEIEEIDDDRVRLRASSRAEVVRTGHRILRHLILKSDAEDVLIVTDGEGKIRYRIPISALLG